MSPGVEDLPVIILDPRDVTRERMETIAREAARDTVVVLDDSALAETHKEEREDHGASRLVLVEGMESTLQSLVKEARAYVRGAGAADRVDVIDAEPFDVRGHNKIQCGERYVVRRYFSDRVPEQDHEARNRIRALARDTHGLIETLAVLPDPRGGKRLLSVQRKLDGERLTDAVHCLTLEEYLHVELAVLEVLDRIHQAGILHLDAKPGNVLVSDSRDERGMFPAVLLDDDLVRFIGTPSGTDLLGTRPLPPEIEPPEGFPDAQRRLMEQTDTFRLAQYLDEHLVMVPERSSGECPGVLEEVHTDFQHCLAHLSRACRATYPALRPTAGEARDAIALLWSFLPEGERERESRYFTATRDRRRLLTNESATLMDIESLILSYANLHREDKRGEAPYLITNQIARLHVQHGDALVRTREGSRLADNAYASAVGLYSTDLACAPLFGYEYAEVAGQIGDVLRKRSLLASDGERSDAFARQSLLWTHIAALLGRDALHRRQMLDACLLTEENRPMRALYSAVREAFELSQSAGDVASHWGREHILSLLTDSCPDALQWWDALSRAGTVPQQEEGEGRHLRYLILLRKYLRDTFDALEEEKRKSRWKKDGIGGLLQEALAASDLLLALSEDQPGDFWATRGHLFEYRAELRDPEDEPAREGFGACAEQCYSRALSLAPQDDRVVSVCAKYWEDRGEMDRAIGAMAAVRPIKRSPGFQYRLSKRLRAAGRMEEADAALRGAYLRDPSHGGVNEELIRVEFAREQPDLAVIARAAEKVFCLDYGRNTEHAQAFLEEGIARMLRRPAVPRCDQGQARRLHGVWRAWDRSGYCDTLLQLLAKTQEGWVEFEAAVRYGVPPDFRGDSHRAFLAALSEAETFDAAVQAAARDLPTMLDGVTAFQIMRPGFGQGEGDSMLFTHGQPLTDEMRESGKQEIISIPFRGPPDRLVLTCVLEKKDNPLVRQHEMRMVVDTALALSNAHVQEQHRAEQAKRMQLETERLEAEKREKRIQMQLEMAAETQRALLPPNGDGFSGEWQAGRDWVGGDGYHWKRLDDHRSFFCIYDVSGHGVNTIPSQVHLAGIIEGELRHAEQDAPFSDIVRRIYHAHGEGVGEFFITAIFGVRDERTHEITFVNFGHPYPVKIAADGACEEVTFSGDEGVHPLGICYASDMTLPTKTVQFLPGERFLLYTDGVTEAGSQAAMLGRKGLIALSREIAGFSPGDAITHIMGETRELEKGTRKDDCTAVVVEMPS